MPVEKELTSVNKIGMTTNSPKKQRNTSRRAEKRLAFMRWPPFSLFLPRFEPEQYQYQHKDHQEHQQRRHRKPLVAQVLEVVVHKVL